MFVILRREKLGNNMKKWLTILLLMVMLATVISCRNCGEHNEVAEGEKTNAEMPTAIDDSFVDIGRAGIEQEYQRLLLGQWQLLGIDMILNTDLGQEEKHVLSPIVSWAF